jgi:hypothetical protein
LLAVPEKGVQAAVVIEFIRLVGRLQCGVDVDYLNCRAGSPSDAERKR